MAFPHISWACAGFAPWREPGAALAVQALSQPVHQVLNGAATSGAPRFVPQTDLIASEFCGEAYESFIQRTHAVPTRDNVHDFFNGLVWLRLPQAKRRLNDLQAAEIGRRGIGPTRGPLRDALTLFDENGAVLQAPPLLWELLLAREWQQLFVAQRALWSQARLLVFGHALMEKLLSGRKDATAHVLLAPGDDPSIAPTDEAIAAALQAPHLSKKPFTPLPVLGVPGWCPGNVDICFYDDPQVFRPRRAPDKKQQKHSVASAEPLEAGRPAPNCSAFPPTEKSL